jgi:divalent metal cation (Fe/Co/Zn/Cd) transporter
MIDTEEEMRLRAEFRRYAVRWLRAIVFISGSFGALIGIALAMLAGAIWVQIIIGWVALVILWQAVGVRADTDDELEEIFRTLISKRGG